MEIANPESLKSKKTISDSELVDAVLAYRNDTRLNPIDGPVGMSFCLYAAADGSHCLVGQVIVDLGGVVPEYRSELNQAGVYQIMSELDPRQPSPAFGVELNMDQIVFLAGLQSEADAIITDRPGKSLTPWSQAIRSYALTASTSSVSPVHQLFRNRFLASKYGAV